MNKATFAIAEVKSAQSDSANGEFELVMSTDSVDRDGESIVKGAFDPLPESIPVHAFHDFSDPVGRVVPSYDAEGRLVGRGFFGSTPRAQEIRQLVADGVIGHSSVGFMAAERDVKGEDGPKVTGAELLEVSFVSVPSNRDAAILMVKGLEQAAHKQPYLPADPELVARSRMILETAGKTFSATISAAEEKAGARNSTKDSERLQTIHDLSVTNGAVCAGITRSYEPPPEPTTEAPVTPADEAGKSPASNVVEATRILARASLLSVD